MTETELLLTSILNCSRADLYSAGVSLNAAQVEKLSRSVSLRSQGVPLQYILGETEFFGLKFKVNSNVLIPRPETEIMVEEAVKQIANLRRRRMRLRRSKSQLSATRCKILDMGTGSGCIAIALAKYLRDAQIYALDVSAEALAVAKENAFLNNVDTNINFIQSDLFSSYELRAMSYDLIISNPPYIPAGDISGLQKEIHYEPRAALDGGKDGLDFYRRIINESPNFLKGEGLLMMEMGYGQSSQIKNIFEKTDNFEIIEIIKDYSSIDRVIIARSKP